MASYKWPPQGGSVTAGDLTDVGTDGIVVINGTGAVLGTGTSLAQHVADTTHNGYLSSTDWNTFNSKEPAVTKGNLTDAGTDGIVITGGTGAVIGSGTSLAQHVADSTHNGYLSSTDWTTFNNKQAAGNYITALTGDVTASGPGSVAATLATVNSNVGSFTNAAVTVNAKGLVTAASSGTTGNLTDVGTDGIVVTGGTGAVLGSGTSLAQHVADSTHNGYLSSTDWSTFNGKQASGNYITALTGDVTAAGPGSAAATLATVNANVGSFTHSSITVNAKGLVTAASSGTTGNLTDAGTDGIVITGGTGAVIGSGTSLAQQVSNTSQNGYLSSTDWNTFNNKQSTISFATVGASPTAGGATISGGVITLQPANGSNAGLMSVLAQSFNGVKTFSAAPIITPLTASQAVVTSGTKALASLAYTDVNTASAIVQRDASGNFSAGTITAALTGTASGNTTYSANNHGVVLSSATNAMTVLAPDASTVKWLKSGGSSADPAWTVFSTPTVQRFTSSSGNYTTPSPAPLWLKVTAIGGGGGGAGSSNSTFDGGDGGTGGNTTWASTVIVANGGVGATHSSGGGAAAPAGGSVSTTSPAVVVWAAQGGTGSGSGNTSTATEVNGGSGGNSLYGGAGQSRGAGAGTAAIANTGSGGGGGGTPTSANNCYGGGGAAGGAVVAIIPNPSGTYAYAIGAAGTAGTAGTSGSAGGAGGAGILIVEEHYQ